MSEVSQLRWRCRRGMRELDILMVRFLEQHYQSADPARQAAFRELIELPDPQLLAYLMERERPDDPVLCDVIRQILQRS